MVAGMIMPRSALYTPKSMRAYGTMPHRQVDALFRRLMAVLAVRTYVGTELCMARFVNLV